VISDRIAVLEHGRVAQVGTADEVFLRPRTRFVAEFIGRTNLIAGVAESSDTLVHGRLRLRVAGGLAPGARAAVSIRPHDIALALAGQVLTQGSDNTLRGTVTRASFLGESVDYQVRLDDDVMVRVVAPAGRRLPVGAAVDLRIDPAACVSVGEEPR
jgi:ABC-type Fe3+/spermidine/putrescine transport system ATPase subunit